MSKEFFQSGSDFESKAAYSRAVKSGPWIWVSGTTGYDYQKMQIADDIRQQTRQCLENIRQALLHFGADFSDVVRVRYILQDKTEFEQCWPILKEAFGAAPPAATMWQAELLDPQMKIEIECTAFLEEK